MCDLRLNITTAFLFSRTKTHSSAQREIAKSSSDLIRRANKNTTKTFFACFYTLCIFRALLFSAPVGLTFYGNSHRRHILLSSHPAHSRASLPALMLHVLRVQSEIIQESSSGSVECSTIESSERESRRSARRRARETEEKCEEDEQEKRGEGK